MTKQIRITGSLRIVSWAKDHPSPTKYTRAEGVAALKSPLNMDMGMGICPVRISMLFRSRYGNAYYFFFCDNQVAKATTLDRHSKRLPTRGDLQSLPLPVLLSDFGADVEDTVTA